MIREKTDRLGTALQHFRCWLRLLLAGLALHAAAALGQSATLFENAAIITGDGNFLLQADVLVEGDSIIAVGDSADFVVPQGSDRVDLSGQFLMPAMIDAHTHLGYQSPQGWGAEFYTRQNLLDNLRQYAYYGFSAAFSAGSDADDVALSLSADQRAETDAAARLLFAAGMGPPGQGPNDAFLLETAAVESRTGMTVLRGVGSPVEAILQVREVAAKGIPFIKIWIDDRGGSQDKLAEAVYLPLIAEARRQRIPVFAHQQLATDMPPLIDAGVSGFLHGRLGPDLSAATATASARNNIFIVPNLGLGELRRETIGRDPFLRAVLPEDQTRRLATETAQRRQQPSRVNLREEELRASMARLLAAGVDIVLGTDAGALPDHPFGYTGHRELEIYVRLGMTPMQALVAATSAAARHLNQSDLGLIAPGHRADLLILNSNPLEDIRNTRSIAAVYLGGNRVDREAIAWRLRDP